MQDIPYSYSKYLLWGIKKEGSSDKEIWNSQRWEQISMVLVAMVLLANFIINIGGNIMKLIRLF